MRPFASRLIKPRRVPDTFLKCGFLFAFICCVSVSLQAQSQPNVPFAYQRLFLRYSNKPSLLERALNSVGLTGKPIGRSFALIAGVTKYPNLDAKDIYLRPADVDIENLKSYLQNVEDFDEIVVLKDSDMTSANLNYFLTNYFPRELAHSPHSRFLFAYSGHGYATNRTDSANGYLLTSSARSLSDTATAVDMTQLRSELKPDVESAEKLLVLINACQSGAFLNKPFGGGPLDLGSPGAHAILASRGDQKSYQLPEVGPGSVFFEAVFQGLRGAADNNPGDGVVTYHELANYLHRVVPLDTHDNQTPMEGDLARTASKGEFYFLNRTRQVVLGNNKPWSPINSKEFGEPEVDDPIRNAENAKTWPDTVRILAEAASNGNMEAKKYLAGLVQMELPAAHLGKSEIAKQRLWRGWFEEVANQGDPLGMEALAALYDDGHAGEGPPDPNKVQRWREAAALRGNPISMIHLGDTLSEDGRGRTDQLKAMEWFRKCADLEDPECMVKLGDFYDEGIWVVRDYRTARQWYEKAAARVSDEDQVDPLEAMDKIAKYYQNGLGVSRDPYMAKAWSDKAAALRQSYADARVRRQMEK